MSTIRDIRNLMRKENVNASLGGRVVSSFFKRHPDIFEKLKIFISYHTCFKSPSEVLSWIYSNIKIKKCHVCGKRIDYTKGKRKESLFCSMECRKSNKGNEIWKNLVSESMSKKYGESIINNFQREDIKKKIRETNFKKFGVSHAFQNKEVREKQKRTMIERYGVENASQMSTSKLKILLSGYNFLREKLLKCNLDFITPFNAYHGISQNTSKLNTYVLKCKKCDTIFKYKFNSSKDIFFACPHCHTNHRSRGEEEIFSFVKEMCSDVISNDRTIINGLELDIYIPSKKIAIEYNGLYWHSDDLIQDKNYHLKKTNLCAEKGIKLIHIFEDEWKYQKDIVKSRLRHILKAHENKIYARKCELKIVTDNGIKYFLNKYHIQGYVPSSINLGLYYNNKIVALMTFSKPRFNLKYQWELIRYCTKDGVSIVGGASKLFSYFKNHYKGDVISYADRRWSDGNLYRQLGFTEKTASKPGYFYVMGDIRFHRMMFQKHKLPDVIENYDENLSEYENMKKNGYWRVWDCGSLVFEYKNPLS